MSSALFCVNLRMSQLLFACWCEFLFSQEMLEIKIIQHSNFLRHAHLQRRENTCFKGAYLKSSKLACCKQVLYLTSCQKWSKANSKSLKSKAQDPLQFALLQCVKRNTHVLFFITGLLHFANWREFKLIKKSQINLINHQVQNVTSATKV